MLTLNQTQETIFNKLINNKHTFFKKLKSFYIHGKTGCGKTTIIEKFATENYQNKKILLMHFHDYLLDISKLLHKNPLKTVAKEISNNIDFICFDEFFIENIADGKILHDIFSELIKNGTSIILTSNFSPNELYKDGFNRHTIFPMFSNFLIEKMEVHHIQNTQDFRISNNKNKIPIIFNTNQNFEEAFNLKITQNHEKISVDNNHNINIIGRFPNGCIIDYHNIFQHFTSIKDFRKLARTFTHIHIQNFTNFDHTIEDEAIRFRNFIDILYTRGTILTIQTKQTINTTIFQNKMLENIKFKRCQSRIYEMETQDYIFAKNKEIKRKMTILASSFFEEISKKLEK